MPIRVVLTLFIVCLAVFVSVTPASAQTPNDQTATDTTGGDSAASTATDADEPAGDIPNESPQSSPGDSATSDPAQVELQELTDRQLISVLAAEIDDLRAEVAKLRQSLRQTESTVAVMEEEIASLSGITPMSAGDILGAMEKDEALRRSFSAANQGKLNFVNTSGEPVIVFINGTRWRVIPNDSYIYVPVGKVTIQHVGKEKPTFFDPEEWAFQDGMMQATYRITK